MRNIIKQIWRFLGIAHTGSGKWFSLLLLAKRHNNWSWSFWRRRPKATP